MISLTLVFISYNRGLDHAENGRFEDSITAFTKAVNLQPNNINLFIERAESYLQLCDFQSAIINYKRAHSLEPHNPYLYEKLAFIYYLQVKSLNIVFQF